MVIASRYREGSAVYGVPRVRRMLSYLGGWLFRVVFPISGVRDYTCGYRAYRAAVMKQAVAVTAPRSSTRMASSAWWIS